MSSTNLLLKGKEVVLHYLGPEGELDWMAAFAEIGHLLNGLGNIQVVMVGPEVPTNLSGTMSGISSRVRVNLVRGVYQEEAAYLPSLDIVIALNCGLESYPSWRGALDLIKSKNIPAFFTDQSEISCSNAKQYYFSFNRDSMKIDSSYLHSGPRNELLNCDASEISKGTLNELLNLINRIVAKISFSKMLLFPEDNNVVQSLPTKADGDLKELPLGRVSKKKDRQRLRFLNILVNTWHRIVRITNSSETSKGTECLQLFKFLEAFVLRNIL
ncbi:hypothetical protein NE237_014374 [Protea cynaroides]|uniref:Mitochondrial splicing suppressor 51-like C-terminal domain-containing protein n=1 Tax=Protea cynaroides TaxID=273540 RepID=A0A9Q0KBW6_9MAGN|nr:hypothetical protein NE237_014374 [Protea cynaroides]